MSASDLKSYTQKMSKSMLTEFFVLCQQNDDCQNILYEEVPLKFYFDEKTRKWVKRKKHIKLVARLR
jgi:hypothetical protein